jgi:tRNA modification GTPase
LNGYFCAIMLVNREDTIAAPATPAGSGAIAIIRLSGPDAMRICSSVFMTKKGKPKDLSAQKSHTLHFGGIYDGNELVDEVLVSVFKQPHSYTGEDTVEISCHGSVYIQKQLLSLFTKQGARLAEPGEFTMRAFFNRKLDLAQAEAVADLIAADSAGAHHIALQQMRGGFSNDIKKLRDELIHFASLIELELDFSEEDVEFADRNDLKELVAHLLTTVNSLAESFRLGNVLKNGIPVAIVGKPNAGKSTLLNALVNDERAIVSDIPGTTRDTIEEEFILQDVHFRFIDTAGIRETADVIESMGVERTYEKIGRSVVVIYLFDPSEIAPAELKNILASLTEITTTTQPIIIPVLNKSDLSGDKISIADYDSIPGLISISAKNKLNLDALTGRMLEAVNYAGINFNQTIIVNERHREALQHTATALEKVMTGLNSNITGDFLASDIRQALYHLGLITGEISTDDLLQNIFSRFCIGK